MIVDAQVHIWAANTPERPWPARHQPHRATPITADELLETMKNTGVDKAILVPPSWEGERNDVCIAAAQQYPDKFAVMGRFDPTLPESRTLIPTWKQQPGMLGMRFTFHRPVLQPLLTEGIVDFLWPQAEKAAVPVMMYLPQTLMPLVDKIAERHPGLKLIIDHLGMTQGKDAEAFANLDKVLALAKRPNVAVKFSSIPMVMTEPWPYRGAQPYLQRVYDAFGPKRLFWASDWSRLPCSYKQSLTMYSDEAPYSTRLSAADKEWMLGRGIGEWLNWK
ncbi:MAG: amidohydrolase family protein [Burkholderiales bacterium]